MGNYFGTDGVRGVANVELTPELVYKLGRAGAYVLTKHTNHTAKIIVGMDTRISGDMLESALIAGICSVGAHAVSLGIVPTPAVAYLVCPMIPPPSRKVSSTCRLPRTTPIITPKFHIL